MARKSEKTAAQENGSSAKVKQSAQQIWLAGLGAFAKAQEEGSRMFDALVKEGLSIQRKTQTVAEERFSDATTRMSELAADISAKASGQWGKLETIFEERVAKALRKLNVPSAKDIDQLNARIDDLNREIAKLSAKGPVSPRRSGSRSTAKRASPRKSSS